MEIRPVIDWIINTYLDNHREKTLKHVKAVAGTAVWLAGLHRLDPEKAETAAMLHDISVIMTPQQMYEEAQKRKMKINPAEEKYHFLLHQRISEVIASERFGITDTDILNTVACHTTLRKDAGPYDKTLFIADKICCDQEGLPPYFDTLKQLAEKIA